MNEKIQVLDVSLDHYRAKEAMKKFVQYMETEPVNTVEVVTMNTLMQLLGKEEKKKCISEFDMTVAADRAMLEAAGMTDSVCLKEAENMIFLKLVMRFLYKNHNRVFLLANDQESLDGFTEYLDEYHQGMRIVETATLEEHGKSNDMIVNRINGAEAECILSILPTPIQEEFIIRNRSVLNARVWMGLGTELRHKENTLIKNKLKAFLGHHFLKREIEKERKKSRLL